MIWTKINSTNEYWMLVHKDSIIAYIEYRNNIFYSFATMLEGELSKDHATLNQAKKWCEKKLKTSRLRNSS